jgi:hypothetical protein
MGYEGGVESLLFGLLLVSGESDISGVGCTPPVPPIPLENGSGRDALGHDHTWVSEGS